jgi:hypothetical protein
MKLKIHCTQKEKEGALYLLKITVKDCFFIIKTSKISYVSKTIQSKLSKYKYRNGIWDTDIYYPLVKHINDNNVEDVFIDVIGEFSDAYNLLKNELVNLHENLGKKGFLNKNATPIVPQIKKDESSSGKYLTINQKLNYYRFLKKFLQSHQ